MTKYNPMRGPRVHRDRVWTVVGNQCLWLADLSKDKIPLWTHRSEHALISRNAQVHEVVEAIRKSGWRHAFGCESI